MGTNMWLLGPSVWFALVTAGMTLCFRYTRFTEIYHRSRQEQNVSGSGTSVGRKTKTKTIEL